MEVDPAAGTTSEDLGTVCQYTPRETLISTVDWLSWEGLLFSLCRQPFPVVEQDWYEHSHVNRNGNGDSQTIMSSPWSNTQLVNMLLNEHCGNNKDYNAAALWSEHCILASQVLHTSSPEAAP